MKLFAQITKVDEAKRMVYGRAVAEVPDRSDEVFDYASSKAHFAAWSKSVEKDSDGKSLGNVRAMHSKVAAGVLKQITFEDGDKAIDVGAKIVDDNEWKKVEEGVYTGFSIGGSYVKKWKDADNDKLTRYTADPSEISLVDRPCIPSATFFDIQKSDGTLQKVAFKSQPENMAQENDRLMKEQADADLIALAKAGAEKKKNDEAVAAAAAEGKDKAKDGKTSVNEDPATVVAPAADAGKDKVDDEKADMKEGESKDKAKDKKDTPADKSVSSEPVEYVVDGTSDDIQKLAKAMHDNNLTVSDVIVVVTQDLVAKSVLAGLNDILAKESKGELRKGMYSISRLADLVQSAEYLCNSVKSEEAAEKDYTSVLPDKMQKALVCLVDVLKAMVLEETAELLGERVGDAKETRPEYMALAAKLGGLEKVGARNNKSDKERVQRMHDLSVEMLAQCTPADKADIHGDLAKLASTDLKKAMSEMIDKAVKTLTDENADLAKRLKAIEAQPAAPKAILRAVNKSNDTVDEQKTPTVDMVMKNGKPDPVATAIKMAQSTGGAQLEKYLGE